MKMIAFICFASLCGVFSLVNMFVGHTRGWKGLVIRGGSILSCLVFALVAANFAQVQNALPLYISIALAVMLLAQAMTLTDIDNERNRTLTNGLLNAISFFMFAFAIMSLSEFNLFSVLGGLCFGAGVGLIVCSVRKDKEWYKYLVNIVCFAGIGLMIGTGVISVLKSVHMLSSIVALAGGGLLLISKMIEQFAKDNKIALAISRFLFVLATTAMAASIFFY